MKAASFFAFAIFLFPIIIFCQTVPIPSQNNSNKQDWSMEYSGGLSLSLIDRTERIWYLNEENGPWSAGWNVEFDMMGGIDSIMGMLISTSYTSLFTSQSGYDNYSFLEITFGPRFYGNYGKQIYFIEGGLGSSMVFKSRPGGSDSPYMGLGINFGAGTIFNVADDLGLLLKCKIHYAVPVLKSLLYAGLQTGIAFGSSNNRHWKQPKINNGKVWSFTLSGGLYYPIIHTIHGNYMTSGNFGIELARNPWQKVELFGTINYSNIVQDFGYFRDKGSFLTSLSIGPRFYINESNTSAFIETGGDLAYYGSEYYSFRDNFTPGINLGTGIKQKLINNINFILKANSHFLFSSSYYPAVYFTAAGGIRLEI
jgi:hypothetical protein